jgi:D-alanyl-lipoteichoic acid acyltransferase DltB (MBOAT superfamily)
MLFNSIPFVLGFLPPVLLIYWLLARHDGLRLYFLLLASVAFYGYWDWRFEPLLLGSILFNWLAALAWFRFRRRSLLVAAITVNLLSLAVFKYLGFFAGALTAATGWRFDLPAVLLPIGISFFTFHNIIYLADLHAGRAPRYSLRDYGLYIALFPQILAGPLVRYYEIVPQFRLSPLREGWEERLAQGVALFLIGLAKKIALADALAPLADPVFAAAGQHALTRGEAWTAALAFPLQIYFDFSGYSDMAIGLALMLGFGLPVNFNAPYRADGLREFWRRWHMTLSRFLRDYLYIPLGGNRHGLSCQMAALLITMALGGLWHGAGWTFVVWGVLHGVGLAAGVLWRRWFAPIPRPVGWAMLMGFLLVSWVFFRAPSLPAAWNVLVAMAAGAGPLSPRGLGTIAIAAAVVFLAPTSQGIVGNLRPYRWLAPAGAFATLALLLKLADGPAYEFIYFHF